MLLFYTPNVIILYSKCEFYTHIFIKVYKIQIYLNTERVNYFIHLYFILYTYFY